MKSIELVEVGWADDIVEVFVSRRPRICGDVYRVVFNNIARDYIARGCIPHEEQDREAIEFFACLLNDESAARKAFYVTE